MPYTVEEGGRLNNFASEPKVYEAEPPTASQKRNYIALAVGAAVLIGGLLSIAASVS
ncbi:MAG: ssl1498 family light-harvesting-like protein [Elainellaceae cyanobacterium]